MRYPETHKEETRGRILDRAAALFRRQGYQGVGIDRIMSAAKLTRGGFYAHFRSKAALFAEVLRRESDFVRRLRASSDVRAVIAGYLDPDNRERVGQGCTLASLTTEIPRRDRAAKLAFTEQVRALIEELSLRAPDELEEKRARAVEAAALCVGGIGLARGIGDDGLAREILAVCRDRACEAMTPDSDEAPRR